MEPKPLKGRRPKVPGSPLSSGPDRAKVSQAGLQHAGLKRLKAPSGMTGTAAHVGKTADDRIGPKPTPKRTPAQMARNTPKVNVNRFKPAARLDPGQVQDRRGQYKGPAVTGGWSKPVGPAYPIPRSPRYPGQPARETYGPPTTAPKPKRKYKL